jgi:hypothetical protein
MKAFAILFLVTLSIAVRADDSVDGDQSPNGFWLSQVELRGDELILKRSSEGLGFSFQEDGGTPPVACPPNSIWKLPLHRGATFFGRESTLVVIPANRRDHRTLFLTEETNRRGDVHTGLLLKSPSPNGRTIVNGVTYVGLLPWALHVTSKTSLATAVAMFTK